jgi:hypothetical protein
VGPLSHLRILVVSDELVRLALASGTITVETPSLPYEIEFRGVTIRIEAGAVTIADGVLTVGSGTAMVTGARDLALPVSPGTSLNLLARSEGPVFLPYAEQR